ncbi:hypothetical protein NM04_08765 [Massilia aurea]|uniref:Uncharacterized protein n=1 Tax=Massilia aurea TaxID=373040 RepID=A0A422QM67_9BURK|nr:hypothetical protein [Massilia aurea]RNF31124.1 hypothetical protein NM04_08765 [Massilia aurea]
MRFPFLLACVTLSLSAGASTPNGESHHVFAVTSLPADVQTLLQARHGDIAGRFDTLSRTCLVDPSLVGQRLAMARVEPQRIQVDIEHARKRELTRVEFRLEDGAWIHASTESVVPIGVQKAAFAAALQKMTGSPAWTPLPTDGTIGVNLPKD